MTNKVAIMTLLAASACTAPKTPDPVAPAAPERPCTNEQAYTMGLTMLKARFPEGSQVNATSFMPGLVAQNKDGYYIDGRCVVNGTNTYYYQSHTMCLDGEMMGNGAALFDPLEPKVELGSGVPCDATAASDIAVRLVRSCMKASPEPVFPAAEDRIVTTWGMGSWNVSGFVQHGNTSDHFYVGLTCVDGTWYYDVLTLNYLPATPGMGF